MRSLAVDVASEQDNDDVALLIKTEGTADVIQEDDPPIEAEGAIDGIAEDGPLIEAEATIDVIAEEGEPPANLVASAWPIQLMSDHRRKLKRKSAQESEDHRLKNSMSPTTASEYTFSFFGTGNSKTLLGTSQELGRDSAIRRWMFKRDMAARACCRIFAAAVAALVAASAMTTVLIKLGLIGLPARDNFCKHGSVCEWEVIYPFPVRSRRSPSFSSPVVATKPPGSVVVGQAENEAWLRLIGEEGFIAFNMSGIEVLKRKEDIWYEKIVDGSCAEAGRRPIIDARSCEIAAMAVGLAVIDKPLSVLFDTADQFSMSTTAAPWDDGSRPEGCYMDATGSPRLNLQPGNIGNGVVGDMQPLCATMAYPMTNTRTSSTSTSTMNTRTSMTTSTTTTSTTLGANQTVTRPRSYGGPSFMCFSYMRHGTDEELLVKMQLRTGASIFACDETVVVSSGKWHLGKNQYGEDVFTMSSVAATTNEMGDMSKSGVTTNSWLNSLTFITAFNTILDDSAGRIWSTDFFVKADPDAVLLPDRLRNHVRAHIGAPVYFLNCEHNGKPVLYGAVEIFSEQAMRLYEAGRDRCIDSLNWRGWGEDSFFSKCMAMLGCQGVSDFGLVGDARCGNAPCTDHWRAAFHPFKDLVGWDQCWRQAGSISDD